LTEDSAVISGINGKHWSLKSHNDVLGFVADQKTIKFFPKDLDKFFKNLKSIYIQSCKLKEIHQSDLKVFPNLVYIFLVYNEIEVIEDGLFDFNPDLEYIGFYEGKLVHIDPNVFDRLNNLSNVLLSLVRCVNTNFLDSIEQVQEGIKLIKSKCSNSELLSLENQIKNLDVESKTLNSEDLNIKLENFEKSFDNSIFSKFRPLNYKFQNLKMAITANQYNQVKNVILSNDLKNITGKFDDLKASQCGLNRPIDELKTSQNALQTTLIGIKSSVTNQVSKLDQIETSQIHLNNIMDRFLSDKVNKDEQLQNNLKSCLESTNKSSQDTSLINLTSKFNDLKEDIKSIKDDTKLSISDIAATFSDQKRFQNDVKDSLIKIRTSQNEVKVALNDNFEGRDVKGKLSDLSDKVESLEGRFVDFTVENSDKLAQIEKELINKLHKMSTNLDDKIKGIEKRLMNKFEEILVEKLGKIFDEKLEKYI